NTRQSAEVTAPTTTRYTTASTTWTSRTHRSRAFSSRFVNRHTIIPLRTRSIMTDRPRKKQELRSQQWFGRQDRDGFAYRSWVKAKGIPHDQFDGRPVIGICNTFSELTPCNSHFRTLAEQVKIGVYEAGGFPLELTVMFLRG